MLLAAQYQRLILQKPEKTLAIIMPVLIGKDKAKTWAKANDTAVRTAVAQWNKDREKARNAKSNPPPFPSQYLVELSKLAEWKIDAQSALFAVEAAHCLAMLDKPQPALEIIDAVGQQYTDETRVLAAECGADLFIRMKMYDRSIEFYGFALGVLDTLKKQEYVHGKGERVFFSEEQKILLSRLTEKRKIAQKLYDEERFGPDWVAYRDAQRHHHAERYLDAYFGYIELMQEFPNTIYSEAANCYLIEILCKLADKENVKEQAKIFKERQKELAEAKKLLMYNTKFRSPETVLENYRTKVDRLERSLKMWKQIPIGRPALEAAERETQKFVERDKYGLYRGESLLNVGLCWLETFLEPEKSEPWLIKANDWFDEVKKLDSALSKLEVPDKSKKISAPPKEERFEDAWTNVKMSKPKPGDLFNRRECKWYISSKHKDAVLWLGLIAYAEKNNDVAETWWKKLYAIDPFFKKSDSTPFGSFAFRLAWNIQNNKGALYATPKEMHAFSDIKDRFALLVADIELEIQNYPKAEKKFRHLLLSHHVRKNIEQASYCTYALATTCLCQRKTKEATTLYHKFLPGEPFQKTNSAPRALCVLAGYLAQDPKHVSNSLKSKVIYEYILQEFPNTEYADIALFSMALRQYFKKDYESARKAFRSYLKKYPKGISSEITESILEELADF